MNRAIIGFDRRIELAWMDAAADCVSTGRTVAETRADLNALLEGAVGSGATTAARAKTIGVLMRLWVKPLRGREDHRDRGIDLLTCLGPEQHVWVHWGTALAAYPFFFDIAANVGRLIAQQGNVSLAALTRRMAESWGDRTTMRRALQRVVRSMVAWGVLRETADRGTFNGPALLSVPSPDVAAWLLEAVLRGSGAVSIPLRQAGGIPALFPFQVELSIRDVRNHAGVEVHREGVDRDVLSLRAYSYAPSSLSFPDRERT